MFRCTQKSPARLVRVSPDSREYSWLRRLAQRREERDEALDLICDQWHFHSVVEEILSEELALPERITGLPGDPLARIEALLDALSEFEPETFRPLISLLRPTQRDKPAEQQAA